MSAAAIVAGIILSQFAPASPKTVGVLAPDGGLQIFANPSIPVYVILPDGGTQILEVQGANGNPIVTQLSQSSLASLAAPTCSLPSAPPIITLTTTPTDVPPTAFSSRTQLIVKNLSSNRNVWCCVGVACTPTATAAYVILPGGDYQNFPVREADTVRCQSDSGTADVNAQEASCS